MIILWNNTIVVDWQAFIFLHKYLLLQDGERNVANLPWIVSMVVLPNLLLLL